MGEKNGKKLIDWPATSFRCALSFGLLAKLLALSLGSLLLALGSLLLDLVFLCLGCSSAALVACQLGAAILQCCNTAMLQYLASLAAFWHWSIGKEWQIYELLLFFGPQNEQRPENRRRQVGRAGNARPSQCKGADICNDLQTRNWLVPLQLGALAAKAPQPKC